MKRYDGWFYGVTVLGVVGCLALLAWAAVVAILLRLW